jgi:hypothetical protein
VQEEVLLAQSMLNLWLGTHHQQQQLLFESSGTSAVTAAAVAARAVAETKPCAVQQSTVRTPGCQISAALR